MRRIIGDTRARQGGRGLHAFWILAASLFLAICAGTAYMLWVGSETPQIASPSGAVTTEAPVNVPSNPANPAPTVPTADTPPSAARR